MKELLKKLVTALEEKANSDLISMSGLRTENKADPPETQNPPATKKEKQAGLLSQRKHS